MEENPEKTLEDQLHEQYAVNDNNRSKVLISFIAVIIALFGFYGYVYVNTITKGRKYWDFDLPEFLLMSFITIGILFFLAILALSFGYSLRRDHVVVNNIRKKRFNNDEKELNKIFGDFYSFNDKGYFDFILDFYNIFYWLFFSSEIFVSITALLKVLEFDWTEISCCNCVFTTIIFISHLAFLFFTLRIRCIYHKKYIGKCKKQGDFLINKS